MNGLEVELEVTLHQTGLDSIGRPQLVLQKAASSPLRRPLCGQENADGMIGAPGRQRRDAPDSPGMRRIELGRGAP
ncbi:MAG: hypothetical protein ACRYGK_14575 [Janthinobacterium lividum]